MSRQMDYTDGDGMIKRILLPDGVPDSQAHIGIVIGPPDLSELDLPFNLMVRLNNELHSRGLLTANDVKKNRQAVFGALQSALRLDTTKVVNLYME